MKGTKTQDIIIGIENKREENRPKKVKIKPGQKDRNHTLGN